MTVYYMYFLRIRQVQVHVLLWVCKVLGMIVSDSMKFTSILTKRNSEHVALLRGITCFVAQSR